jgi:hypothetical protein
LDHVIQTSPQGYRINDARFLTGEIYWRQGHVTDAVNVWRRLNSDMDDEYFDISSELVNAITVSPVNHVQIDAALDDETRRWTDASFARLRQFGFQFDTF